MSNFSWLFPIPFQICLLVMCVFPARKSAANSTIAQVLAIVRPEVEISQVSAKRPKATGELAGAGAGSAGEAGVDGKGADDQAEEEAVGSGDEEKPAAGDGADARRKDGENALEAEEWMKVVLHQQPL